MQITKRYVDTVEEVEISKEVAIEQLETKGPYLRGSVDKVIAKGQDAIMQSHFAVFKFTF